MRVIHLYLLILSLICVSNQSFAQPGKSQTGKIEIKGTVIDKASGEPIWYANVLLFSKESKKQVNGIATDENGHFSILADPSGSYYLEFYFIGYEMEQVQNVNSTHENIDLGIISLHPKLMSTDNIEVEANRSAITYQIDKKIISVDQQSTAISGSAVDVLENVPSVTVDIEGNVSLRGSSNFTVLIDGRPTIMESSEVLQQIPASTIENIEIITNPSVKYDPSGAAGIINVVMKKNKNLGSSGVFNAKGGLGNKYGGDVIYEYRIPDLRTSVSLDYNIRDNEGKQIENRRFTENNISTFTNSNGSRLSSRERFGIRGEFDYSFSASDILSLELEPENALMIMIQN